MTRRLTLVVCAALVVAGGCVLFVVAVVGSTHGEPGRIRFAASLSLPYVVAGAVALASVTRGVPRYTMAVGAAMVPLSMLSIVTLPLVLVALPMLVVGFLATPPGWSAEVPASLVIAAGLVASVVVLFVFREDQTWVFDDGIATSEQTTVTGSVLSLGFLAVVGAVSAVRDRRPAAQAGVGTAAGSK